MRTVLLLLLAWSAFDAHAAVRAWFDRETVTLGESVTLNVEVDGVLGRQPDLSPLDRDFRRSGTSSSAQVSISNGQRRASTLWAVALEPLREGTLTVPALDFGGESTSPLTLTVLPAPTGASTGAGDDAFVQVEAEPLDPFVQQQVRYTVRLHYAVPLLEGQLDEPQVDGARLQRIGNDLSYQKIIEGRRYQIVERRYALAAERSGSLTIPAPQFRGRAAGGGYFGGGGGLLQARGDAIQLEVRPQPPQAPAPWLPTPELQLEDESEPWPQTIAVGEPLTLSLRVAATGLLAEQLPELTVPAIDGAQVYPDRESSQTVEANEWFRGERVRKFAIVPNRAGRLTVPPIRIGWWNTVTDQPQWAELPAKTIEVVPAAGTSAAPASAESEAAAPADSDPAATDRPPSAWPVDGGYIFAALFAVLWMLTLGWALLLRRRAPNMATPPAPPVPARTGSSLSAALAGGDGAAIAAALRAAAPDAPLSGLDAVADRLADPAQAEAVRRFERALYAAEADRDAAIAQLRQVFASPPRWSESATSTTPTPDSLPPLYR